MKKLALILFTCLGLGSLCAQTNLYIYKASDKFTLNPWVRYTSVEGAFAGASAQFFPSENFKIQADGGFAFAGRFPRYALRVNRSFAVENNEWVIAADYHRVTDTPDRPIIADWQNSLSSLLWRRDFYQHYENRGFEMEAGHVWAGMFGLRLFGGLRDFYSMENAAKFSLMGWAGENGGARDRFRFNAPVPEGRDIYTGVSVSLDTRPSALAPVSAWIVQGRYTNAALLHGKTKSDFDYQHLLVSATRQMITSSKQKIVLTAIVGSYQGDRLSADSSAMAEPFLFDGGGYGTLRGYGYKEFSNHNRMALVKIDYSLNGTFLPKTRAKKIWGIGRLFAAFDFVFFADAGYYWTTPDRRSFAVPSDFRLNAVKADAGFGLTAKDWVRFDVAFPLRKGIITRVGDWSFALVLRQNF